MPCREGAPIDGLVLWAAPARGRELTRQLKAFARLEASQVFEGLPDPPPMPEGEMEVGGFVLTQETQADLGDLDLSTLAVARTACPAARCCSTATASPPTSGCAPRSKARAWLSRSSPATATAR